MTDPQKGVYAYFSSLDHSSPLAEFQLPPMEVIAQREMLDRSAKAITPRPPAAYPETFDLSFDEVWPKDEHGPKKVLVVGDPYRRCDRDNTTIVDYEYIEEIFPPIHGWMQSEEYSKLSTPLERHEWWRRSIARWIESIHQGNEFAVDKEISGLGLHALTVPRILVDEFKTLAADIVAQYADVEVEMVDVRKKLAELKNDVADAKKGKWAPTSYLNRQYDKWDLMVKERYAEEIKANFFDWYVGVVEERKATIDVRWGNYLVAWKEFLNQIPPDQVQAKGLSKKVRELQGWLDEMPEIHSPDRIDFIMNELERSYYQDFHPHGNDEMVWPNATDQAQHEDHIPTDKLRYALPWRSWDLERLLVEMGDDFFVPGRIVNRRVSNYMDELTRLCERLIRYEEAIAPVLDQEENRIFGLGIRFDIPTLNHYLESFERPLMQEHFNPRGTQRAIAIHGFFPDRMPPVDPQDRILALYSVSTHLWDSFREPEEFYDNIKATLPFLKPGGKYIVGPVNYAQYRVQYHRDEISDEQYGFPGAALHDALHRLKQEGAIADYFFRTENKEGDRVSTTHFEDGSWAASLIIQK